MPLSKNTTDIRDYYPLYLEIGLILALSVVIIATRLDFTTTKSFEVTMQSQSTVDLREIQQTRQETAPPPPPRPPVPIEVPNTEVVEEKYNFDASLDFSDSLDTSMGPPAPDENSDDGEKKKEPSDEIFIAVEQQPELVGGMKALQETIQYPSMAEKAGIEGRVYVQFVIDEQGNVRNPKVLKGAHSLLDKEAIRVIKEQTFKPGKQRGTPVKVRMTLPVVFRLEEKKQ